MRNVLKIKIHQPTAHYRVPFSYQRRFTYPIPPFSTVKGMICNLMGIRDDSDELFNKIKKGLSLAIYGRYESIVKEYVWFRNIEKDSHVRKFNSVWNRIIDTIPQHPGGQMPVTIDVLQNVNLLIYIYHPESVFLEEIKRAFENPKRRLSTIHLGRSEDWLVIEEIMYPVKLRQSSMSTIDLNYFTWIPAKEFANEDFIGEKYDDFFDNLNGNLFRLPVFYKITDDNQRVFSEYITVKLFESRSFKGDNFYIDIDENIPLIFSKLRGNGECKKF